MYPTITPFRFTDCNDTIPPLRYTDVKCSYNQPWKSFTSTYAVVNDFHCRMFCQNGYSSLSMRTACGHWVFAKLEILVDIWDKWIDDFWKNGINIFWLKSCEIQQSITSACTEHVSKTVELHLMSQKRIKRYEWLNSPDIG